MIPVLKHKKNALQQTAKHLVSLVKDGNDLVITHGNGPQVGNLLLQNLAANSEENPAFELDNLVAMTQGSIGYWLQNAMQNELNKLKIQKNVTSIITQVLVHKDDPAFQNPSKPIGPYYSESDAKKEMENTDDVFKEDAGRGWRKVVPSPNPITIKEIDTVKTLIDDHQIVIACGGGGVPVIEKSDKSLQGVEAVIDKDFASQKLASEINADVFIVLTAVDNVYINYNTDDQEKLNKVNYFELDKHLNDGQFAAGSMLPKVQSTMDFVKHNKNSRAVITSLSNLKNLINNESGTIITYSW